MQNSIHKIPKAIFLDRDGVVNEIIMRGKEVGSPRNRQEFVLRDDFINATHFFRKFNGYIFIISNQPDIERGKMEENVLLEHNEIIRKVFSPDRIVYCPCSDGDHCECKKPKPGMINDLMVEYSIAKTDAVIIGDSWKDIEAGQNAGIKTILLNTPYNQESSTALPDFEIGNLVEFFIQKIDYLCFQ